MNSLYDSDWVNLKLRRAVFIIGLAAPFLAILVHIGLRAGTIPNLIGPLILLSAGEWFIMGLGLTVLGTVFLYSFRCPRCGARFFNFPWLDRKCFQCGLPEGVLSDPNANHAFTSSPPIPEVPSRD